MPDHPVAHHPAHRGHPAGVTIASARQALRSGQAPIQALLEASLAQAQSDASARAYVHLSPAEARAQLATLRQGRSDADLARDLPLAGLAVSVKDLFDVRGQVTAAGSRVLGPDGIHPAPAAEDSAAVARVRAAGGVLIGRTQMTEFAFSGVGVNPHVGTPANPADRLVARVPGGSSSGAAVSVAAGGAWAALGSDTGGSLRIPAALCGLVGYKGSTGLVSARGTVPLSPTLDTIGAITRSVRDAITMHTVLSGQRVVRAAAGLGSLRLAVVRDLMCDQAEPAVMSAFERAVSRLSAAGARLADLPLAAIHEPSQWSHLGSIPAAESHAWHRDWIDRYAALYDPRVRQRIVRGGTMMAADYLQLLQWRQAWTARLAALLRGFDALLSPTVPIVAPPLADVAPGAERDDAFFRVNALLLRNTSVINLLDGCALSLPCHRADLGELPVGLMVWGTRGQDDAVLNASALIEQALSAAGQP